MKSITFGNAVPSNSGKIAEQLLEKELKMRWNVFDSVLFATNVHNFFCCYYFQPALTSIFALDCNLGGLKISFNQNLWRIRCEYAEEAKEMMRSCCLSLRNLWTEKRKETNQLHCGWEIMASIHLQCLTVRWVLICTWGMCKRASTPKLKVRDSRGR